MTGWVEPNAPVFSLGGRCRGYSDYLAILIEKNLANDEGHDDASTWYAELEGPAGLEEPIGIGTQVHLFYSTGDLSRLEAKLQIVLD